MFDVLFAYLKERMPLTAEQFSNITPLFIPKHLEKGELLLREGEVARYGAFVSKGCLRSYVVDEQGKEHVIQFAPENWWLTDTNSIMNNTPTLYFMDAIEPTDVLLLDMPSHIRISQMIPGFTESFQKGVQKHTASKEKRIISSLTTNAEERYLNFLDTYPTIALRVPQHMLASYLGITPETLSRVRKKQSRKK